MLWFDSFCRRNGTGGKFLKISRRLKFRTIEIALCNKLIVYNFDLAVIFQAQVDLMQDVLK